MRHQIPVSMALKTISEHVDTTMHRPWSNNVAWYLDAAPRLHKNRFLAEMVMMKEHYCRRHGWHEVSSTFQTFEANSPTGKGVSWAMSFSLVVMMVCW